MPGIKITLLSQVLALVDRNKFAKLVNKHDTDKFSKGINSWTHFVAMLFMQLSGANSLRDISNGLKSATGNLSHMGVTRAPSKSSMSYINEHRTYELFMYMYFEMLDRYEPSLAKRRKYAYRLKKKIFIMDASIIPLCLSLFDWAKYKTKKGALKLHAILDYDTGLPCYASFSDGKQHDVTAAKQVVFPADSVIVVDRAYVDFQWLYNLDSTGVFFVTRLKKNAHIQLSQSFLTNERHEHILSDEDIELLGFYTSKKYPRDLRIVRVYDEINDKILILLTNQRTWTADTISQLYKSRWDVEVFFKQLKQLFRVKSFVGLSPNAVRIQMWSSLISILLLSYLKATAKYKWHLSNLISFLRMNLFVKIDLWKWLNKPILEKANAPPQNTLFS